MQEFSANAQRGWIHHFKLSADYILTFQQSVKICVICGFKTSTSGGAALGNRRMNQVAQSLRVRLLAVR